MTDEGLWIYLPLSTMLISFGCVQNGLRCTVGAGSPRPYTNPF